jgi:acetyl-CoA acetyltransferase
MRDVVIVEAVRTPIGKFRGSLADVRADHLGAIVIGELARRAGLDPARVDDVVFGCVTQVGEQCGNIARTALLSAGWPQSIPGMTVDRKCGSAEAALHVGYAQIASGVNDIVVAGGAENMTRVPMGGNRDVHGKPFGWKLRKYPRFPRARPPSVWWTSTASHATTSTISPSRAISAPRPLPTTDISTARSLRYPWPPGARTANRRPT